LEEIKSNWRIDRTFEPKMAESEAAHRRSRWAEAIATLARLGAGQRQ
jgi:glycerol kinase